MIPANACAGRRVIIGGLLWRKLIERCRRKHLLRPDRTTKKRGTSSKRYPIQEIAPRNLPHHPQFAIPFVFANLLVVHRSSPVVFRWPSIYCPPHPYTISARLRKFPGVAGLQAGH